MKNKRWTFSKKAKWIIVPILAIVLLAGAILPGIFQKDTYFPSDMPDVAFDEGDSYVPEEVLSLADSLAHAKKIAAEYDLELKSYAYGVAVFITPNPEAAVEFSKGMQQEGMPELSLNLLYQIYDVDAGAGSYIEQNRKYASPDRYDPYARASALRDENPSVMLFDAYNDDRYEDVVNRMLWSEPDAQGASVAGNQWHHEEMDTERAWAAGAKGAGVTVAVIDTGIYAGHPAFQGRISSKSYNSHTNQAGIQYVDDNDGHGTHVSGIAAGASRNSTSGVAPEATIMAIKADIPSAPGWFEEASLLRAINYAVQNDADIINMSLGRPYYSGVNVPERTVIANAVASGVTIVCSAGNDNESHAGYPAAYPQVIAVSATRQGFKFDDTDSWSNYGPEIDVAAPGSWIYSADIYGSYTFMSGTSMASPNVAGVAALIKANNPGHTPQQIREVLHASARDAGEFGRDDYFGHGIVNAYAAILDPSTYLNVTYDFNDGSRDPVIVKSAPGNKLIEPRYPKLEGYVFTGWYVNDVSLFNFKTDTVTTHLNLTARWTVATAGMYAVEFPDMNFCDAVLQELNDRDGKNRTPASTITSGDKTMLAKVLWLSVAGMNISDMTGLKYFTGLEYLYCYNNQLTMLNVSNNKKLKVLDCDYNELNALDVTQNTALVELWCSFNEFKTLDISKNTKLKVLVCEFSQVVALDVSKNIALQELWLAYGQLKTLDVSKCTKLKILAVGENQLITLSGLANCTKLFLFDCGGNNLTKLDVSKNTALIELWCRDNQLTALNVANCTMLDTLFCMNNNLATLNVTKNTALWWLDCSGNRLTALDVSKNPWLMALDCADNQLRTLKVTGNTNLIVLNCSYNQISALDVSKCTWLWYLLCGGNQLTKLDVSKNTELEVLACFGNQLTALDVSKSPWLFFLECSGNNLATLNVSANTWLADLYCSNNQLRDLNVSKNTQLQYLECDYNQLTALDISNNTVLAELWCSANALQTLNVSNNPSLQFLHCGDNALQTLNVSNNPSLQFLHCGENELSVLDVSNCLELRNLHCYDNRLSALDISSNSNLEYLNCWGNDLSSVYDVNGWQEIGLVLYQNFDYFDQNVAQRPTVIIMAQPAAATTILQGDDASSLEITAHFVGEEETALTYQWYSNDTAQNSGGTPIIGAVSPTFTIPGDLPLGMSYFYCEVNAEGAVGMTSAVAAVEVIAEWLDDMFATEFPDPNFCNVVLRLLNMWDGGSRTGSSIMTEDDKAMLAEVYYLDASRKNIRNMTGLHYFSGLEFLGCDGNRLTTLDVSSNIALRGLYCYDNQLVSLDVSNNRDLINLYCGLNQLTTLDVSNNTELTYLFCGSNQLTALDLLNNTQLMGIEFFNNKLTSAEFTIGGKRCSIAADGKGYIGFSAFYDDYYFDSNDLYSYIEAVPEEGSEFVNWILNGTEFSDNQWAEFTSTEGYTLVANFDIPTHVPGAPKNLTAIAGNGQVALNWTVPSDDGGSEIIGYEVSSDNGATWVDAASDTAHTFAGLINETEYIFKVRAVNAAGVGAPATLMAMPITMVPDAPQDFMVSPGSGQVTLSWLVPSSDGGSAILRYEVSNDNGATWTDADSDTGHIFFGLTNGTEYIFIIRAINAIGESEEALATAIPSATAIPPSAPRNFTATPGNGQIMLNWATPSNDGGSAITGYEVSNDNGATWVAASSNTGHTFNGLINGTTYTLKVRALNIEGEGAEAIVTEVPGTVPGTPQNFTTTFGNAQVTLSWTAPASGGGRAITRYEVWNEKDARWITASSDTEHTFTGLTNGTEYTFKVRAVNVFGNGAEATKTETPRAVPTAPQNFTATHGNEYVVLSWTAPANDGGRTIIRYEVWNDEDNTWVNVALDTAYTFTSLTNGTEYTFKVRAINDVGDGAEATAAATPQQPPLTKLTFSPKQLFMVETDAPQQLTVNFIPADTDQTNVVWTSNNTKVATVDQTGLVTALSPGTATIEARSADNRTVNDYCAVTVAPDPTAIPSIIDIRVDGSPVVNGRILDDLFVSESVKKNVTLSSGSGESVTWKSSDTKVATIAANGTVKYVATGTTTITATVKSGVNKGVSERVVLTIKDTTPKLPINAITVNTLSDGTAFKVLPSDNFTFDDVEIVGVKLGSKADDANKFVLEQVSATEYRLKTNNANVPKNGKYTLALRAKDGFGNPVGVSFNITVTVTNTVPKVTAKMPTLNTFWIEASGKITLSGKDVPKIVDIVLEGTGKAADGSVTENFTVSSDGTISAKENFGGFNSKGKLAVKGVLKIYYEGYGDNYYQVSVTVSVKETAPKLTLTPAKQTISKVNGEAVFEVTGGTIQSVELNTGTTKINKANSGVSSVRCSGNRVTLEMKPEADASNTIQVNVMLVGARKAILIKPVVKTTTANTTYKLSASTVTLNSTLNDQTQTVNIVPDHTNIDVTNVTITPNGTVPAGITVTASGLDKSMLTVSVPKNTPAGSYKFNITPNHSIKTLVLTVKVDANASSVTATVKAGKGNIDLVNQNNTMRVYTPTIKGTTSDIVGVQAVASYTKKGVEVVGYDMFDVSWNAATQKVEVRTKDGEVYQKDASYTLRFEFELAGGNTVTTGDVTIKPTQSTVKHNVPKQTTMYQSCTTVDNYQVIDLKSSNGAKISEFGFKAEKTDKNGNITKYVNNPNDAYWYYFDYETQLLHIWVKDSALVKTGKATLVFSVVYEGQGVEKSTGVPKPIDLKVSVNVVK